MTPNDVMEKLRELGDKEFNGEITEAEAAEAQYEIIMRARLALSDEEILELQRQMLTTHHLIAKYLTEYGSKVPGNDPHKPN